MLQKHWHQFQRVVGYILPMKVVFYPCNRECILRIRICIATRAAIQKKSRDGSICCNRAEIRIAHRIVLCLSTIFGHSRKEYEHANCGCVLFHKSAQSIGASMFKSAAVDNKQKKII